MIQKLWAVGAKHKRARMPDPFHNNSLLKSIIANNTALDDPSMPKVPVTNSTLKEIRRNLQLHRRPDFVLWVGLRFAESQSGQSTTSTQYGGNTWFSIHTNIRQKDARRSP